MPPLIPFHRTIKLPPRLWSAVKMRAKKRDSSARGVIADAVGAELIPLIRDLARLGFDRDCRPGKLVRLPVDDNVIGRLNSGRRSSGLPAVQLLVLCLRRHLAVSETRSGTAALSADGHGRRRRGTSERRRRGEGLYQ